MVREVPRKTNMEKRGKKGKAPPVLDGGQVRRSQWSEDMTKHRLDEAEPAWAGGAWERAEVTRSPGNVGSQGWANSSSIQAETSS